MSDFVGDAIYWIETDKIVPNPYQPRREFNEEQLQSLADSIRQYGILEPLVATKKEIPHEGGITVQYELIAGERRLRASRLAGITKVPAIIRADTESNQLKLELAIIENLQREDLNPVDRAMAFARLANEFEFTHTEIAKRVGKSREYVSNTLRLLSLPQDVLDALSHGKISEGHARPLMMLNDRPQEQSTLFKDIVYRKLTVREAEEAARHVAKDKVRKKMRALDPEMASLAAELTEALGTRVEIESRSIGGKVVIDFFSPEDLRNLVAFFHTGQSGQLSEFSNDQDDRGQIIDEATPLHMSNGRDGEENKIEEEQNQDVSREISEEPEQDSRDEDPNLYTVSGFTV